MYLTLLSCAFTTVKAIFFVVYFTTIFYRTTIMAERVTNMPRLEKVDNQHLLTEQMALGELLIV